MKAIIPIDFSTNSVKALEFALGLFQGSKSTLILCHVVEMVYDFASQTAMALDSMHADSRRLMEDMVKKYSTGSIELHSEILEGTPSVNIARFAEEKGADLIIMGTHGIGGIKKILVGSTAVNVIRESSIPVLLVPEEASIEQIRAINFALEITAHEENFIEKIQEFSSIWRISIQIIHIFKNNSFWEKMALSGLEQYLEEQIGYRPIVNSFEAKDVVSGIRDFIQKNPEGILAMCHTQKSIWETILGRGKSIELAYKVQVPMLVMI